MVYSIKIMPSLWAIIIGDYRKVLSITINLEVFGCILGTGVVGIFLQLFINAI